MVPNLRGSTNWDSFSKREAHIVRSRILFLAAIIIVVTTACRIGLAPSAPPCPIEDLLLDETPFHGDFYRGLPSEDLAPMRFGIDKIGVDFGSVTRGGGVLQDVYLGSSTRSTQKQFTDFVGSGFSLRRGWTEWYVPDSFDYQSSVADQYRFACYKHIASGVETCQAVGQYGPYLIRLHANMSPILAYQDLERAFRAIDAQAAQCLGE